MKKIMLSYSAPELDVFEVAVEGGYGDSYSEGGFGTPDFGSESGGWDD